jgi:penicillin-binding protein 1A
VLRQIPEIEGALVALDPATGRVLALAGGWSFDRSQFNRATQAQRQPGSSFKPFVYMAAIESGVAMAESMLDAPFVIDLGPGAGKWRPNNYSLNFNGMVPLYMAIAKSLNLVTVRLADRIGLETVAETAQRFGIVDNMPRVFPAALGAVETTVLRMAGGYAAFANGGKQVTPTVIDSVQDRDGTVIWRAAGRECQGCEAGPEAVPELADERHQLTDPVNAYSMNMLVQGVVTSGTGGRAAAGLGRPIAGKTGTTNDFLDAWFVGFTPDLVVAVWVGFDTPTPLGGDESGGALAAPIFHDFMAAAMAGKPVLPFHPPAGVVWSGWPAPAAQSAATVTGGSAAPSGGSGTGSGSVDSDLGGLY